MPGRPAGAGPPCGRGHRLDLTAVTPPSPGRARRAGARRGPGPPPPAGLALAAALLSPPGPGPGAGPYRLVQWACYQPISAEFRLTVKAYNKGSD